MMTMICMQCIQWERQLNSGAGAMLFKVYNEDVLRFLLCDLCIRHPGMLVLCFILIL